MSDALSLRHQYGTWIKVIAELAQMLHLTSSNEDTSEYFP